VSDSILEKRERAFEAVFFAKLDEKRIAALREKRREKEELESLTASTGISDSALLKRILEIGVDAASFQALSLVPLVSTAWASGDVSQEERAAALQAAEQQGVSRESGAYQLLEAWLDERPGPELEAAWADYLRAVLEQLDPKEKAALKQDLLRRCRQVAKASGGFLGIGQISAAESRTLRRLADAMDR
jgi:hypothetical protein